MADDAPTLELRIQDNSEKAVQGILSLANSLSALKVQASNGLGLGKVIKQLETFNQKFQATFNTTAVENITKVADALGKLAAVREVKIPEISIGKVTQDAVSSANVMPEDFGQGIIAQKTAEAADQMRDYARTVEEVKSDVGKLEENVADVDIKMEEQARTATRATDAIKEHAMSLKDLAKAGKKVISPLDKVISAFKRILFYRVIRSVLREIAKGFSEGIKNVRAYSKAIGGSFDKAMTSVENALFKMKNSLGAALAPALEAIIPYVQQLVSWFITLVNYVNQFFALLQGKTTWTKAIDAAASDFEKTKKSASGAAKEIKNLLAGFDELNIIQSESGGGGGSTGTQIAGDYKDLFTEETVFDNKVKGLVDWLKNNLNEILEIAGLLGATFLAWRISNAFGGALSVLSYLAALGTLALTFKITGDFDEKFLETGEPGYLVGSILTAMLGGLFTKSILEKVLNKQAGIVGFGLAFLVSAAADIVASVKSVDTSALSERNLRLMLMSAVKGGVAGGAIGKALFGLTGLGTVQAFGGAALATFGIGVGIKAVAQAMATDETEETLKAKALSSLTLGAGVGIIGHALNQNISVLGLASGAALVTYGVYAGVQAVAKGVKAGWTADVIANAAKASLGIGVGSAIVATVLGAPAGVAGIVGTLSGVLTVGAIVGVTAILRINKKDGVTFGNISLAENEIKNYVQKNLFPNVDVDTTVNLVNTTVGNIDQARKDIEAEVLKYFGEFNVIKLGVETEETYGKIKAQLFGGENGETGVIDRIKKYAEDQTTMLKTGIAMVPIINEAGEDVSKEFLTAGISGWTGVEEYLETQGKKLSELLLKGINDGLDPMEKELVEKLLNEFNEVTKAVTSAQVNSQTAAKLTVALTDLDESSFHGVIDTFLDYRNQLKEAYTSIYSQELQSFASLAAFYEATGNDELAQYYKGEYDRLSQYLIDSINDATDKASKEGSAQIAKAVQRIYGKGIEDKLAGYDFGLWSGVFGSMYDEYAKEAGEEAVSRTEYVVNMLNETLLDNIAEFTGLTRDELSTLGTGIDDILSEDLLKSIKTEFVSSYANMFGLDMAEELAKALGVEIPEPVRQAIEAAIKEAFDKMQLEKNAIGEAEKEIVQAVDGMVEEIDGVLIFNTGKTDPLGVENELELISLMEYDYNNLQKDIENQQKVVDNYKNAINKLWEIRMHPENYTPDEVKQASKLIYDESPYGIYAMYREQAAKLEEMQAEAQRLRELIETPIEAPAVETSSLTSSVTDAGRDVNNAVNGIIRDLNRLSGASVNIGVNYAFQRANNKFATNMFRAGGGFVTSGDMFVARENGVNEYVGRIGNRTAVANNDQIVSGVASGVAAGQSEQNSLLRQQNDLLRQMLAKSGRVEAVPSADWGRFVKRSSEMYAYNTGM